MMTPIDTAITRYQPDHLTPPSKAERQVAEQRKPFTTRMRNAFVQAWSGLATGRKPHALVSVSKRSA